MLLLINTREHLHSLALRFRYKLSVLINSHAEQSCDELANKINVRL